MCYKHTSWRKTTHSTITFENSARIPVENKVNEIFDVWMKKMHGVYGKVKATRDQVHGYVRMTFDFSDKNKSKMYMIGCMNKMLGNFTTNLKPNNTIPDP